MSKQKLRDKPRFFIACEEDGSCLEVPKSYFDKCQKHLTKKPKDVAYKFLRLDALTVNLQKKAAQKKAYVSLDEVWANVLVGSRVVYALRREQKDWKLCLEAWAYNRKYKLVWPKQ